MKALVTLGVVLIAVQAYAVDERFLGGPYDGHALAGLITYSAPPAAAARFHGGARDGHASSQLILYDVPASALDRFRGGVRDGHASEDSILFDAAVSFARFRGGSFDGFESSSAGPFVNPLDFDTDGDGLPDWWELPAFNNLTGAVAGIDQDGDGFITRLEYTADTNPNNATSFWRIVSISVDSTATVYFVSSPIREYSLEYSTSMPSGVWSPSPGQTHRTGVGGLDSFREAATTGRSYRVQVFGP